MKGFGFRLTFPWLRNQCAYTFIQFIADLTTGLAILKVYGYRDSRAEGI